MKRLLITLSVIGCLLYADPSPIGNWKLSGLKVDYLHIARETTEIALNDIYGANVRVVVATVPAGAVYARFTNGPFTLPIIEENSLNLNVNLYPDGTGAIAEGSFYPDIDLIPGTCITSPQVFPVTDEFVWEVGQEMVYSPTNIIGIPGLNNLAGSQAYGFGLSESGTFDGWPASALMERVPTGLNGIGLTDGTTLAYSCGAWCFGTNGSDGGAAGAFSGDVGLCVATCSGWDHATASAYSGGGLVPGWLAGSGSSGMFNTNVGNSQMGQDVNVDFLLEWNAIDGVTSASGIDLDDEDGDGDNTEYNRIFGYPYLDATFIDQTNPLCDITGGALAGGTGLNYPVAGDIVSELGGQAGVSALVTGKCIEGTTAVCEAAGGAAEVVWAGCMDQVVPSVEALCAGADGTGTPQGAVAGLCFEASQDPSLAATCDAVGVGTTVTGACLQLGFDAETCASAAGLATAGIADACQSGVEAGANAACDNAGGLWNTLYGGCLQNGGDEATCAGAADAGVAGYGDCATWAGATYADATCADAGTTDCAVLVTEEFSTGMCDAIGYGLTTSTTCNEWAWSVGDAFAAQSEATGNLTCTQAAEGATGIPMGSGTAYCAAAADALFALQAGMTCTAYGDAYIGMCVETVASANDMYLMDPTLATWGLVLTYNAASVQQYLAGGYDLTFIATNFPELLVNDSAWDFDPSCYTTGETCSGRLVMNFEPTCIPELEARQIVAEFVDLDDLCEPSGDANGDNATNVVDIVRIVDHILGGDQLGGVLGCQADINGDGVINVVDVVAIVQGILGRAVVENDATTATLSLENNQISIEANGHISGVELVVEFTGNLDIDFANNYIADYSVDGNTAHILLVSTDNVKEVLTVNSGTITSIVEAIVVNSSQALETSSITIEEPATFVVGEAFPNPFNPSTNISLELTASADISVKVYNLMGQLVSVIAEGSYSPNTYNWTWNAENLASGAYLVKTQVGSDVNTQKVMLLK
jgi:hypothetical protein